MNHVWIEPVRAISSPSPWAESVAAEQAAHAGAQRAGDLAALDHDAALLVDQGSG